jgi:alpha-glucuronidase
MSTTFLRPFLTAWLVVITTTMTMTIPARGEDGYRLWLRYAPVRDPAQRTAYRAALRDLVVAGRSPSLAAAELESALTAMLDQPLAQAEAPTRDGTIVLAAGADLSLLAPLDLSAELRHLGDEGFILRSTTLAGHRVTLVASASGRGALYGTFALLRLIQTGQPIDRLDVRDRPALQLRLLDHWDNLDGSIERGYAGRSLWKWDDLPDPQAVLDPRYRDYARAMASVGLNGAVLNNVNASPRFFSRDYLRKAAALADVFRPCGVRVYLSANFASPKILGHLPTADPLDPRVAAWWKAKADEIYALIPDFGGFLVKANSEGQPGPQDYRRTHADGANVLADALAPHGGIVMWRAFVYDQSVDADRAKRAYIEFTALDGKFRPNVILQVKNGPIDFQPS